MHHSLLLQFTDDYVLAARGKQEVICVPPWEYRASFHWTHVKQTFQCVLITFVFWIFPFKPDVIYCLLPPSDLLPVRSPLGKTVPFFHDQDKVTTYSHLETQEGMLYCESFGVKNLWLIFHLGHFYPPKCRGTLQALSLLISDGICEQLIFL